MLVADTCTNRRSTRPQRSDIDDVVRALALRAEAVAISLLGAPSSTSQRALYWGSRGSFCLCRVGHKRGLWIYRETDDGGNLLQLIARVHGVSIGAAIRIAEAEFLAGYTPLVAKDYTPHPAVTRTEPDDDAEARIAFARRMSSEAKTIRGTLAEIYFAVVRGLDVQRLDVDHALRWHARARAVIGLMTHAITGEPVGVHRTFLNPDGTKRERKMLGRQGVIRLSPDDAVTTSLAITEGVEDALAVLLSGWAPVWAATSSGAIARFPVLPGIETLTIFADADDAGLRAAETCRDRWRDAGREAVIVVPGRFA
jgi:putative DNA primase/helicase